MELGNQMVFHNLLIITQLDNIDTRILLFARGRGERFWTIVKIFFGTPLPPQSRADQLQIFTICLKD
jgi:hypothetical protein